MALAPTLSLVDAVTWHDRLRGALVVGSPLLAIAKSPQRMPFDRSLAVRCLEIDDPSFCDSECSVLVAAQDAPTVETIDRAARELMTAIGAHASH
jgi:hypothetical protein